MRYMVMEKYVMLVLLVSAEANAVFNRLNFEQVELAPNATCFPAILVTPTGSAVRCAIACSRHEDCVGFLTDAAEKCFVFPRNAAGITEVCNFSGARYFRLDVATTPTPQMTTPVDVATTLTPQMTTSLAIVNCQNFLRYNPTSGSCSSGEYIVFLSISMHILISIAHAGAHSGVGLQGLMYFYASKEILTPNFSVKISK
ncbi:hypothetical protein DPMN_086208 [Dreissena polymorpha]|uniref:Apple domain-containing protein n=1 Tax=Dreissena polymorpha TaxID=45954 RepID=A0A9D4BMP0_DREPO|nr:hypothetical protein DPMN_086208 [Dreissena polymorpha]